MLAKIMAMIVLAYAVLGIFSSAAVAISPNFISSMRDFFGSETGRYLSVALNILVGAVFLLAAPATKFPLLFKVFGGYLLFQGLVTLLISGETWSGIFDFWLVENSILYRTVGVLFGIVFFAFILYAAFPRKAELFEKTVSEDET